MKRTAALAVTGLLSAPVLGACAGGADETAVSTTTAVAATAAPAPDDTSATSTAAPDGGSEVAATSAAPVPTPNPGPVAAALALAPADTAYLTVTDWAAIKRRLGAEELTSESLQTDTIEFWRSVGSSTVLLTDGALREENSRLRLRHGVTQDDALWEVRWVREDAADDQPGGLALRLRDDLDLAGLEQAVADEVPGVTGAQVFTGEQLLLRGAATEGSVVEEQGALAAVLADDAESGLAVPGCLPWPTALGVDATVEQQEAVAGVSRVDALRSPRAWGMSFTGRAATLTLVHEDDVSLTEAQADAAVRVELAEVWPTTESVGWVDAFGLPPRLEGDGFVVEETDGQVVTTVDYRVVNPTAAATVALAGLVPGAVCAEIDWLAEPTGL